MLSSLFGSRAADGRRVRIVRVDKMRKTLGLGQEGGNLAEMISTNDAKRSVRWLRGVAAADLSAGSTELRPEGTNPRLRPPAARPFRETGINRQFWSVKTQRPLVMHEFHDVMVASHGNDFAIFRGTTIDERSIGVVQEIHKIDAGKVQRLGTVALCDDPFMPSNPCHVIVDRMTRAVMFRDAGVAEADVTFAFGKGRFGPYVRDRVVPAARMLEPGVVHRVERLLMLSTTFNPAGHPFWYGDAAIMAQIVPPLLADLPAGNGGRKIYLARTDATRRRLLNEPDLIAALERHGFETVVMGTLSPREQLALCRDAATIVAPHGAAMTNAIAAPAGTRVVELFNPQMGSAVYAIVSDLLGHRYTPLFGTPVPNPGVDRRDDDQWRIDVDAAVAAALA